MWLNIVQLKALPLKALELKTVQLKLSLNKKQQSRHQTEIVWVYDDVSKR